MTPEEAVRRAFEAFRDDVTAPPPLTLRGGNDVDDYNSPAPFDSAIDEPTDLDGLIARCDVCTIGIDEAPESPAGALQEKCSTLLHSTNTPTGKRCLPLWRTYK